MKRRKILNFWLVQNLFVLLEAFFVGSEIMKILGFVGDPAVDGFEGNHLVFVGAGSDPFGVITDSVK